MTNKKVFLSLEIDPNCIKDRIDEMGYSVIEKYPDQKYPDPIEIKIPEPTCPPNVWGQKNRKKRFGC
jgi:hypothetical protein